MSSRLVSFNQLLATVVVSKNQKKFVCNPSITQLDESEFELIITGSQENIVMVELEAKEITEKELYKAIAFAQKEIQKILHFFQQIAMALKVKKKLLSAPKKTRDKVREGKIKKSIKNILTTNDNWLVKEKKMQETFQQFKD